jgi:hypothetical protein
MATTPKVERPIEPFFYGFQPHWLSWDRVYRIYASERLLAGAFIAGQLYDEQAATILLQQSWRFLRPVIRRRLAQRRKREALYDSIDPFTACLLVQDARNFQMPKCDVAWTRLVTDRSWWTPFNAGIVEIGLRSGAKVRFILVGGQNRGEVLQIMERFDPAIEVTGKPRPRGVSRPTARAGWRSAVAKAATSLLGF